MAFKHSFVALFLLAASVVAVPQPSKGGKDSCKATQFWYSPKSCCLDHNGPVSPPKPPPSKDCPSTWYWHSNNGCCVPRHPNPPPPTCKPGSTWVPATQCCEPHGTPTPPPPKPSQNPQPPVYPPPYHPNSPAYPPQGGHSGSGGYGGNSGGNGGNNNGGYGGSNNGGHGGNNGGYGGNNGGHGGNNGHGGYKKRALTLCPKSLEACPVVGLNTNSYDTDYECMDTTAELRSCGGCTSTGKGQDCTAIEGAWNVGCEAGTCAVYTCALGYKVAADSKSCVQH